MQMAKENPGWGYDRIVGALANLVCCCPIRRWATFSVGMGSLLLLRENRPSPGKTLSVHTWKFWSGRIFSLWKSLP